MSRPLVLLLRWPAPAKGSLEALIASLPLAGYDLHVIDRGKGAWQDAAASFIRRNAPDYIVMFQRLYPHEQTAALAATIRRHRVRPLVLDFGIGLGDAHYQTVLCDPQGDSATSSVAGNLDTLAALPAQAAAIEANLPVVDAFRERLESFASGAPPIDVPRNFHFLALQKPCDQVVRYDSACTSMTGLAQEFIRTATAVKTFGVIKPHPFDSAWAWPDADLQGPSHLVLPRDSMRSTSNDKMLCWMMKHAARCVFVNSTLHFAALALDRPVSLLGRSWSSGNAVVDEVNSIDKALAWHEPIEWDRRRRFLALMFSRQRTVADLADPDKARALLEFFHEIRAWEPVSAKRTITLPPPARISGPKPPPAGMFPPPSFQTVPAAVAAVSAPASDRAVALTPTAAAEPESRGFAVIAMGAKYLDPARACAASIAAHHPDVPISVITNLNGPFTGFPDTVKFIPVDLPVDLIRAVKTRLPQYVDFDRCIAIDADCTVAEPLDEVWTYLDYFDAAFTYDTLRPTVGARVKAGTPLIHQSRWNALAAFTGDSATMPQTGFIAWRRTRATLDFYRQWYGRWREMGGGGDSDSFTWAAWNSDLRFHTLIGPVWQNSPGRGAKIAHNWGCLCRQAITDPELFADSHFVYPIVTPIYIPDPDKERYPDTPALVRRCISESVRGRRIVGIAKAPDEFVEWCELAGHETYTVTTPPPNLNAVLAAAQGRIGESKFFWTIEQDSIVTASVARRAEAIMAELPDSVAAIFLPAFTESGERTVPVNRPTYFLFNDKKLGGLWQINHAPFNGTLWRTEAFRAIDFTATAAHMKCDLNAGTQLRAKGWKFVCAHDDVRAIHFRCSSH